MSNKQTKPVEANVIPTNDIMLPKGNYIISIDTGIGHLSKTMVVSSAVKIETLQNGVAIPVSEVQENSQG